MSDYLQTIDLDYVQAWRLISCTQNYLNETRKTKFLNVYKAAKLFAAEMSKKIEDTTNQVPSLEDVIIETELPVVRSRKKKKMPGEVASDETIEDSRQNFEVNIFNVTLC